MVKAMKLAARLLRKGDVIQYCNKDLRDNKDKEYVPLEGEIIRIAYTDNGMSIKTASGVFNEVSRNKHFVRTKISKLTGRDCLPIINKYHGAEHYKGRSIE